MSPRRDDPAAVDQPEPEDVLSDAPVHDEDHVPADGDDRDVLLDEPAAVEPPIDDDDRDPARGG